MESYGWSLCLRKKLSSSESTIKHTPAHTCTHMALAHFQSSLTKLDLITVHRPFHLIISTVLTIHNAPRWLKK